MSRRSGRTPKKVAKYDPEEENLRPQFSSTAAIVIPAKKSRTPSRSPSPAGRSPAPISGGMKMNTQAQIVVDEADADEAKGSASGMESSIQMLGLVVIALAIAAYAMGVFEPEK
eukprot:SAG22_NODE_421_length_10720_cov_22.582619_9_plen_114_part_00